MRLGCGCEVACEGAFQRDEVGGVDLRVWGRVCEIVRRMWDGLFGSGGFEKLGWGGGVNVRWGVGVRSVTKYDICGANFKQCKSHELTKLCANHHVNLLGG